MMALRARFAARTDKGLVRRGNQDCGYASPYLLAVADGMGGMAAGDLASSLVISAIADLGDDLEAGRAGVAGDDEAAIDVLRDVVADANERLREAVEADPGRHGMGTTLTGLLLADERLALVHIGDSRGYLMRDGKLHQLTRDDTFVQLLVDDGHITPEEAETHPQRCLVTKALQGGDAPAEYTMMDGRAGDRYLLCSDGLSGVVGFATLELTLRDCVDLGECAERLINLALDGGGPDNITAVVAELVDGVTTRQQPVVVGAAAGG